MIDFIDLGGKWQLFLDEDGIDRPLDYDDEMILPDTTSNARKGKPNPAAETGFLTDSYKFEGTAWFRRKVSFEDTAPKRMELVMERTRITEVFVDGESLGVQESFVSPHVYDLTPYIGTGEHILEISVRNVGYKTPGGHMTSQDTQTNWNGIVGKFGLVSYGKSHAENVRIDTDISEGSIRIRADIIGETYGKARVTAELFNTEAEEEFHSCELSICDGCLDGKLIIGQGCHLWSEHDPALYRLRIDIDGDVSEHIIGLREFSTSQGKFTINGRKTFLRGKHDGMIFPKTGYAPCTVDEWLRVMGIVREYGINHYRFHTCCPPEAAFIAADMLGIYMEPQLPFWGTIAAPGEEGFNAEEQEFLISEGFAMLREFGNHPSFCMMSMGNELWGSTERINNIIGGYKAIDKRHLYTQGSNNFQWFPNVVENDDFFVGVRLAGDRLIRGSYAMCDAPLGHIQTEKPGTRHSYDPYIRPVKKASAAEASADGTVQIQFGTTMKTVRANEADADFIPEVPIVTHEIGQFETYPDFREIEKYTGSLKARNFEIFRDRLRDMFLDDLAEDYFHCSGKLAVDCYKEELEAALRSELLAGFQILDIQDFSGQGTALVGILDAFMDSKGLITPEQWRGFCNDTVLLAMFDSYTPVSGESFSADIKLVDFSPETMVGRTVSWRLEYKSGELIKEGSFKIGEDGNYINIGTIEATLPFCDNVTRVFLVLELEGTDVRNSYRLEVIPDAERVDLAGAYIFSELDDEARTLLEDGKTVLILPEETENSIPGFYCQDFWCYPMFSSISRMMNKPEPVGTMGLVIDNEHPALFEFSSCRHSTPMWWEIVENSHCMILDDETFERRNIIRMIDNFERNHDLSLLYEYRSGLGKVVVCSADINKLSYYPEGRAFVRSLIDYVRN